LKLCQKANTFIAEAKEGMISDEISAIKKKSSTFYLWKNQIDAGISPSFLLFFLLIHWNFVLMTNFSWREKRKNRQLHLVS
jgi:hypothetical protein